MLPSQFSKSYMGEKAVSIVENQPLGHKNAESEEKLKCKLVVPLVSSVLKIIVNFLFVGDLRVSHLYDNFCIYRASYEILIQLGAALEGSCLCRV